jgi:hypothetical protein
MNGIRSQNLAHGRVSCSQEVDDEFNRLLTERLGRPDRKFTERIVRKFSYRLCTTWRVNRRLLRFRDSEMQPTSDLQRVGFSTNFQWCGT